MDWFLFYTDNIFGIFGEELISIEIWLTLKDVFTHIYGMYTKEFKVKHWKNKVFFKTQTETQNS